jgi:hypothetical protein
MYNAPARHCSMATKIETDSRLASFADWVEAHPLRIAVIFALLLAIQITPELKMSPDGVSYMSVARSLIEHGRLLRLGSPHLRYAPGYPIFISPAFLAPAWAFIGVQILQWIYALLLFWGVYAWFAPYAGRGAIWIAALTLANAGYWDLFRTASSEIVFAPCLIWAGVLLAKTATGNKSLAIFLGALIVSALACATRQAGVMLVPGFVLAAAISARNRRILWRRAIALSVIVTLFTAVVSAGLIGYERWGARQQIAAGDTGYTQVFFQPDRSLAGQMAEGLRRQSSEVGRLLIPGMWKTHGHEHDFRNLNSWLYAVVCIPVAIGWWRLCRRTADPLALMLPFYIGLCVAYPFDSGTRFTVPVFAVLAGSVWFLLARLDDLRGFVFLVLVAVHAMVSVGFWISDAIHVYQRYAQMPEIRRVAEVIPTEAKVIALRVPGYREDVDDRWMFLMWFTDRPVAPETTTVPVAGFVDWIITPIDQPDSKGFHTVAEVGDYRVERINP